MLSLQGLQQLQQQHLEVIFTAELFLRMAALPFSQPRQSSCMHSPACNKTSLCLNANKFIIWCRIIACQSTGCQSIHRLGSSPSWHLLFDASLFVALTFLCKSQVCTFLCACLCHWPDLPWVDIKQRKKSKNVIFSWYFYIKHHPLLITTLLIGFQALVEILLDRVLMPGGTLH